METVLTPAVQWGLCFSGGLSSAVRAQSDSRPALQQAKGTQWAHISCWPAARWLWRNDGQSRISGDMPQKSWGTLQQWVALTPLLYPSCSHPVTAKSAPERLTVTDSKGGGILTQHSESCNGRGLSLYKAKTDSSVLTLADGN